MCIEPYTLLFKLLPPLPQQRQCNSKWVHQRPYDLEERTVDADLSPDAISGPVRSIIYNSSNMSSIALAYYTIKRCLVARKHSTSSFSRKIKITAAMQSPPSTNPLPSPATLFPSKISPSPSPTTLRGAVYEHEAILDLTDPYLLFSDLSLDIVRIYCFGPTTSLFEYGS
ncbi:hypothetical protein K432DRAFT_395153 [Lepidopterella palustris CBS 459.81]|uniref:Uncharacterized protein n=1 Tax=Lepidopterella palustris CBS 459.81 TaxID=1314670 RepID=A0A8E2E654_9PEZI|nr:hypothetical protein K432DRAFT_395153 [Lepidopterella palustris CBS 459.81]